MFTYSRAFDYFPTLTIPNICLAPLKSLCMTENVISNGGKNVDKDDPKTF